MATLSTDPGWRHGQNNGAMQAVPPPPSRLRVARPCDASMPIATQTGHKSPAVQWFALRRNDRIQSLGPRPAPPFNAADCADNAGEGKRFAGIIKRRAPRYRNFNGRQGIASRHGERIEAKAAVADGPDFISGFAFFPTESVRDHSIGNTDRFQQGTPPHQN